MCIWLMTCNQQKQVVLSCMVYGCFCFCFFFLVFFWISTPLSIICHHHNIKELNYTPWTDHSSFNILHLLHGSYNNTACNFQVPRNRYWGLHPPPVPIEEVIDDGLMSIQRAIFLKKAGLDTAADEDFLLNPPSKHDLLESAIKNIIRYLDDAISNELLYLVPWTSDITLRQIFFLII